MTRWKDKSSIDVLADDDSLPITDTSDGDTDKRWSPSHLVAWLAEKSLTVVKLGIGGATPDATNKLSVNSPAVLFNHDGDDSQVKVNKAAAGDTASFLFQTAFSGRAEIGLVGDDDFVFKVSPDGSSFITAITIDKDDATVKLGRSLYYDDAASFIDRNAKITISADTPAPASLSYGQFILHQGKGDNTNFIGVGGLYVQARDRSDVTASNKGVLYGVQIDVHPLVARGTTSPADDVVAIAIKNSGDAKATEAIYIGANTGFAGSEFFSVIQADCDADDVLNTTGTYVNGIDFSPSTFSGSAILLPNDTKVSARNAADDADLECWRIDGSNILQIGVGAAAVQSSKAITSTSAAGGIGYGIGAGGTVTQLTSKSTTVTLNTISGQITMHDASLATNASVVFLMFNNTIGGNDTISLTHSSAGGTNSAYVVVPLTIAAGGVTIRVTNISGGSLNEAVKINFNVHKGAAS